jgi:hypothetical protein
MLESAFQDFLKVASIHVLPNLSNPANLIYIPIKGKVNSFTKLTILSFHYWVNIFHLSENIFDLNATLN